MCGCYYFKLSKNRGIAFQSMRSWFFAFGAGVTSGFETYIAGATGERGSGLNCNRAAGVTGLTECSLTGSITPANEACGIDGRVKEPSAEGTSATVVVRLPNQPVSINADETAPVVVISAATTNADDCQ